VTLIRTVDVGVSQARAFAVWTERVGMWWPPGHSMTGEAGARMAFEGEVGGRLVERAPSGREIAWGRILSWDPPLGLSYAFFAGAPPGGASEVEVQFEAVAEARTRVVVTHRPGSLAPEAWAGTVSGFEAGWAAALPSYSTFTNQESP